MGRLPPNHPSKRTSFHSSSRNIRGNIRRSTPRNTLAVQTNAQSSKSLSTPTPSHDSTVTPSSGRSRHLEITPGSVPDLFCSPTILPLAETSSTTQTQITTVSDLPTSETPSQRSAHSSPPSVADTLDLHQPQRTLHSIAPLRLQYENQNTNDDLTEKLSAFMTQQAAFNQQLMTAVEQQSTQSGHSEQRRKVCIPKAIQAAVRDTYNFLQDENGVTILGLFKKAKELDKVVQKTQRVRSRRNTKRLLRRRALEESTSINEENKVKYKEIMTAEYMLSEDTASDDQVDADMDSNESGSENDQPVPRKKKLTVKSLQWRSSELDKLMTVLDKKIARKRGSRGNGMVFERIRGSVLSQRPAPLDAPRWSLK